jgi:helix-turn-helix protein
MISRRDQVAALASPVRQELIDVLSRMDSASLADLGAVLGRPADGLYYHVRVLQRVALVVPAGSRRRAGREEALFRAASPELALRYTGASRGHAGAVSAIVASMLRLGIRDFRRAIASPGNTLDGPRRDVWAMRVTGWLTRPRLAELNRGIRGLRTALTRPPGGGRLYGITVLLTPLDHRGRRSRPRRPTGRKVR